jgi:hypothetical protein
MSPLENDDRNGRYGGIVADAAVRFSAVAWLLYDGSDDARHRREQALFVHEFVDAKSCRAQ